jgi:hypothetical protein
MNSAVDLDWKAILQSSLEETLFVINGSIWQTIKTIKLICLFHLETVEVSPIHLPKSIDRSNEFHLQICIKLATQKQAEGWICQHLEGQAAKSSWHIQKSKQ